MAMSMMRQRSSHNQRTLASSGEQAGEVRILKGTGWQDGMHGAILKRTGWQDDLSMLLKGTGWQDGNSEGERLARWAAWDNLEEDRLSG